MFGARSNDPHGNLNSALPFRWAMGNGQFAFAVYCSRMPRLYLIDGYALIYRAFYALISRPLRTSRGENTSAAWGVANFLLRLRTRYHPDYVIWVNDAGDSGRTELYPEYKSTREKLDEAMQQDFDLALTQIESLLAAFRVVKVAVPGWEADDVIGTLAAKAREQGVEAVIVSGDKDFYQLIEPGVFLLNPGRGGPAGVEETWVDESNASERLGVTPRQVVDYLALLGDSSDNVPGVKGIGDKGARLLLGEFGDLDTLLARAGEVTQKRSREALALYADEARLSRLLVTIRRDAPVSLDLAASVAQEPDREKAREVLSRLEFHSLVDKLLATESHESRVASLEVAAGQQEGTEPLATVSAARASRRATPRRSRRHPRAGPRDQGSRLRGPPRLGHRGRSETSHADRAGPRNDVGG